MDPRVLCPKHVPRSIAAWRLRIRSVVSHAVLLNTATDGRKQTRGQRDEDSKRNWYLTPTRRRFLVGFRLLADRLWFSVVRFFVEDLIEKVLSIHRVVGISTSTAIAARKQIEFLSSHGNC
jgi:hypothetical protein